MTCCCVTHTNPFWFTSCCIYYIFREYLTKSRYLNDPASQFSVFHVLSKYMIMSCSGDPCTITSQTELEEAVRLFFLNGDPQLVINGVIFLFFFLIYLQQLATDLLTVISRNCWFIITRQHIPGAYLINNASHSRFYIAVEVVVVKLKFPIQQNFLLQVTGGLLMIYFMINIRIGSWNKYVYLCHPTLP